jgi:hypothetical protein
MPDFEEAPLYASARAGCPLVRVANARFAQAMCINCSIGHAAPRNDRLLGAGRVRQRPGGTASAGVDSQRASTYRLPALAGVELPTLRHAVVAPAFAKKCRPEITGHAYHECPAPTPERPCPTDHRSTDTSPARQRSCSQRWLSRDAEQKLRLARRPSVPSRPLKPSRPARSRLRWWTHSRRPRRPALRARQARLTDIEALPGRVRRGR